MHRGESTSLTDSGVTTQAAGNSTGEQVPEPGHGQNGRNKGARAALSSAPPSIHTHDHAHLLSQPSLTSTGFRATALPMPTAVGSAP